LDGLRDVTARVVNDAETLRAFADKTYLPRLASLGVAVVPTVRIEGHELEARLPVVLAERSWSRAVLKPAFTANAFAGQVFDPRDVEAALRVASSATVEPGTPWLVQPFIEGIADGEMSFLFFGGEFSHAVKKHPKAGEWRVQSEYGGTSVPFVPS